MHQITGTFVLAMSGNIDRAFMLGRAEPVTDVDLENRLGIGRYQHLRSDTLTRVPAGDGRTGESAAQQHR